MEDVNLWQENIEPLGDLVMVRVGEARKERAGLILPKEVQPDIWDGQAVAFGRDVPEATWEEINSCGGGVVFGAGDHEARSYEADGWKYLFVPAKDLMGAVFPGTGDRFPRVVQVALGKWVLMEWEEAKGTMLGGLLVRPVQTAKAHFTGTALLVGPLADEIEAGKRYFFEQFSDFKSWTEGGRRFAFVPASAFYCEIPTREQELCYAPSEVASPEFEEAVR